jgi:hypothetical protein
MRYLMVIALVVNGILAPGAAADTARRYKRIAKPQHHAAQQRASERERLECERAREEDPTGRFAGYSCWAREVFGRADRTWY